MKIRMLGTASAFPTKDRNHVAVLLKYGPNQILFDCGEGTQRQMRIAGENIMKITHIFISHWHGDHVLGIPGILESLTMSNRKDPIHIYGPKDTKKIMRNIITAFGINTNFKLYLYEYNPISIEKICDGSGFEVLAMPVKHRIPTLAYRFQEKSRRRININYVAKFGLKQHPLLKTLQNGKDIIYKRKKIKVSDATYIVEGKKITYVVDTEHIPEIAKLAQGSDLLICEGTFSNSLKNKCEERGHMTVKDAAKLAKKAGVKKLILFHFSQRYKTTKDLEKEAKSIFNNVIMAKDFMDISI